MNIEKISGAELQESFSSSEPTTSPDRPRAKRGFAAMDPVKVAEIARKGGRAAHAAGTAHEFSSDEARVAGSKGGRTTRDKKVGVFKKSEG